MVRVPTKESTFATACSVVGYAGKAFGFSLKRPVFIVGTGRCGTGLLVRILNSHPDIAGYPGEANELWHPKLEPFESTSIDIPPIEADPRGFSEISIANWPPGQADRIRRVFSGYSLLRRRPRVFFTKSAMISFMIPNILEIFPDARFIHIYRFGPSVVDSYFSKNFGKYSRYKFEAQEYRLLCARYWNDCILEIERQSRALSLAASGIFMEFSYEQLCDRPKPILEAMASFLEVESGVFSFDLAKISSRNREANAGSGDLALRITLAAMSSGLELKGYAL